MTPDTKHDRKCQEEKFDNCELGISAQKIFAIYHSPLHAFVAESKVNHF